MEPFSPFDSEYRCTTFDSLPRADVAPQRRHRGLWLLGIAVVGLVVLIVGEIASDWMHSGRVS